MWIRVKRFVYNANRTCGQLLFCSPEVYDWDLTLNTSLAQDPRCSGSAVAGVVALEIVMSLLILSSNGLIVYLLNTSNAFRDSQSMLKTSLATSDFLVGLIVLPAAVYNKLKMFFRVLPENYLKSLRASENSLTNVTLGALFSTCISASLFSLMLLVTDRLLAVHWPFRYAQGELITRRRATYLVIAVWCFSAVLGILPIGDLTRFSYNVDYLTMSVMLEIKANPNHDPPSIDHGSFFLVFIFIIPYVCVVAITIATWCKFWWIKFSWKSRLKKHLAFRKKQGPSVHKSPDSVTLLSNKEFEQITRVIFAMVAAFSVNVLPFLVVQAVNLAAYPGEMEYIKLFLNKVIAMAYLVASKAIILYVMPGALALHGKRRAHKCYPGLHLAVVELLYLNSFSNFLIYNLRNEQFRLEVKKLFRWETPTGIMCTESNTA